MRRTALAQKSLDARAPLDAVTRAVKRAVQDVV